MTNKIINGNELAEKIFASLETQKTPKLELAAVLVGEDKASLSFLKKKTAVAARLGVKFKIYKLSDKLSQKELEKKVWQIGRKKSVGGMIVQLPLPAKYDRASVLSNIMPEKDVDALSGAKVLVLPPAVGALAFILKEIKFSLKNKKVAVVGPGFLIGRPISIWLMDKVKKLTIINKGGFSAQSLKEADLIVTGVGAPNLIKGKDLKKGAIVIDYGYGKKNGKLAGDIEVRSVSKVARRFTPTPGGTGPLVVAQLFANFYARIFNV